MPRKVGLYWMISGSSPSRLLGRVPVSIVIRDELSRRSRTNHGEPALGAILETMRNEFTAIIERDGKWFVAYSPEVPGANGQGRTKAAARKSLAAAIELILAERRRDALRGLPAGAFRETVTIG